MMDLFGNSLGLLENPDSKVAYVVFAFTPVDNDQGCITETHYYAMDAKYLTDSLRAKLVDWNAQNKFGLALYMDEEEAGVLDLLLLIHKLVPHCHLITFKSLSQMTISLAMEITVF